MLPTHTVPLLDSDVVSVILHCVCVAAEIDQRIDVSVLAAARFTLVSSVQICVNVFALDYLIAIDTLALGTNDLSVVCHHDDFLLVLFSIIIITKFFLLFNLIRRFEAAAAWY